VRRLALQHGRDGKLTDWIADMTRDCPRKDSPVSLLACCY
jgi:hypothetical protein